MGAQAVANEWDEFRGVFFEEAQEHLQAMEAALLELECASDRQEVLNRLFRAAHSIKGASATLGIMRLAAYSHTLEDLLGRLRDGTLALGASHVDLLLRATDVLGALVTAERDGTAPPEGVESVTKELHVACENVEKQEPQWGVPTTPAQAYQGTQYDNSTTETSLPPKLVYAPPFPKNARGVIAVAERVAACYEDFERALV